MKGIKKQDLAAKKQNHTESDDEEFEDIVKYKLAFDFSKLVSMLKQNRKIMKENAQDITALRRALATAQENTETVQKQISEFGESQQQATLTVSNYNTKLIDLETEFTRNINEIKDNVQKLSTKPDAVSPESLKEVEKRFAATTKAMEDKIERLTETISTLERSAEKTPTPKESRASQYGFEFEGRLEQMQKDLVKEIDFLKNSVETRLYELDGRLDEIDKTLANKTSAAGTPKGSHIVSSKEEYKASLLNSSDEAKGDSTSHSKVHANYQKQFKELDEAKNRLDASLSETRETLGKSIAGIRTIQRTLADKLKLKIKLDGLDDDTEARVPTFSKEPITGSRPKLLPNPPAGSRSGSIDMDDFGKFLVKEINKCATKDAVEQLEQTAKYLQTTLLTKADKRDLETTDNAISGDLKKIAKRIELLEEFRKSMEKRMNEKDQEDGLKGQLLGEHSEKIQKLEEILQKQKFDISDLAAGVEQRASSAEVFILKQSFGEMSDKIGRLCELLDDNSEQPSMLDKSDKAPNERKSIKLLIFQLDQRIEDLEKRLMEMQELASAELLEGARRDALEEALSPTKPAGSTPGLPDTDQKPKGGEGTGLRGVLARHEMFLNDVNLRISELESGMQKIEPNSMRILIKDIAELVMQEEKKEVSAAVDGLKGSQLRHSQLVDGLRQNLKELDERFKSDIEKKVEAKDLNLAKKQLRRRMQELEIKLKGKDSINSYRSSSQLNPCPMMLYNSKCFFCNQQVRVSPDIWNLYRTRYSPKSSFLKDITTRSQRYGPGYSHMLNSLQGRIEADASMARTTKHEQEMKCFGSPAVTKRSEDSHPPIVKLAPITRPHHHETKQ